jgi:hypothetical protein
VVSLLSFTDPTMNDGEDEEVKGVKEEEEDLQSGSTEESSSSVIPPVNDLGGIPVECTVDCLTCRCDHYSLAHLVIKAIKAYQYR